jgi:Flp pilus assembly protein TadD
MLGRVRLASGETAQAIHELQQALTVDPRSAPARYQLGLAHSLAGNVQQAKSELAEAVAIAPDLVEAVLLLAELNVQTGALKPAIADLERLTALHPRHFAAHALLGSAHLAHRDPARAFQAFRHLVAIDPRDPRAHHLLGIGLRAQGKIADARRAFEAALALAPAYPDPMVQLVSLALAEGQPAVAIARLEQQIAQVPRSGGLQYLRGVVHLSRNESPLAEGAFLKAIELEPQRSGAYVQLARLYGAAARHEEALAKLHTAAQLNPRDPSIQMLIGVIHERKGDRAGARKVYEKLLAMHPRFGPAANNLAWLYTEHGGDKDEALRLAQIAKEAAPDDPRITDTLGWVYYRRGLYERAVGLLTDSATKLPHDPVVQFHLGAAALKLGDRDGARRALSAAIASPLSFDERDEARKLLAGLE